MVPARDFSIRELEGVADTVTLGLGSGSLNALAQSSPFAQYICAARENPFARHKYKYIWWVSKKHETYQYKTARRTDCNLLFALFAALNFLWRRDFRSTAVIRERLCLANSGGAGAKVTVMMLAGACAALWWGVAIAGDKMMGGRSSDSSSIEKCTEAPLCRRQDLGSLSCTMG